MWMALEVEFWWPHPFVLRDASQLQTGQEIMSSRDEDNHKKQITSLCLSTDGSHFLTGSLDKSAKV